MKIFTRLFCLLLLSSFLHSCSEETKTISLFPLKENGSYYYFYDAKGTKKIDEKFAYAGVFREGLAIVKLTDDNEHYTFIGENGKIAIDKVFRNVSVFSEGLAWVAPRNQHPMAIDKNGKEKFSIKGAEHVRIFKDGLAAYSIKDSIGEKWGFVDTTGKTVIQPQFMAAGDFNNGICAVMNEEDQWGFIDKTGKMAIDYHFEAASNVSKSKTLVISENGKFGVIDAKGEYLIRPASDSIVADENTFLVKQDGKWGWMDATGKPIIEAQFENANPFYDNELAVVKQNGLYGYIDKKGTVKIDYQFKKAYPFMGDIAYVEAKDSDKGSLINLEGKVVVKDKFAAISADLVAYLNGGKSAYEMIETDYFDMESILKNINLNTPEGLSFNDRIPAIAPKLFNKKLPSNNEEDLTVSCLRKVAADGYLSSYVIRDKNDKDKIAGFWYKIEIADGWNFYKPHDLEKALIKKLKGYTKIEAPNAFINKDRIKAFKNDKHILLITGDLRTNEFTVEILSLDTEIENFDSRSYSNLQNTDTDDSIYRYERKELLKSTNDQ